MLALAAMVVPNQSPLWAGAAGGSSRGSAPPLVRRFKDLPCPAAKAASSASIALFLSAAARRICSAWLMCLTALCRLPAVLRRSAASPSCWGFSHSISSSASSR